MIYGSNMSHSSNEVITDACVDMNAFEALPHECFIEKILDETILLECSLEI